MKLINLTPHAINIVHDDGTPVINIPPSGQIARCAERFSALPPINVDGVEISFISGFYGEAEGLPDPQPDTLYIVSGLVLSAAQRGDLVAPGPLKRDSDGKPIGCVGLRR